MATGQTTVAFIYSPVERARVDELAIGLEQRGYVVNLGPLGFPIESDGWVAAARKDIEDADCVVLLLTDGAYRDSSVHQRCEIAYGASKQLFAIYLDPPKPDRPARLGGLDRFIGTQQKLLFRHGQDDLQRVLGLLAHYLPKPYAHLCFISYSRADSEFVWNLGRQLHDRGIRCWHDREIKPGTLWDKEIESAIRACSHMLLVWSKSAASSGNVADEVSYARELAKPIIPLMHDATPLPLRVHRSQGIDLSDPRYLDQLVKALGANTTSSSNDGG